MRWWTDIWRKAADDWTTGSLGTPAPIAGDTAYVTVRLRSMRIVDVRRGLNKFYPAVHCYSGVPHLSGVLAEFHRVTKPTKLEELDAGHLDRVVATNLTLLGPIPYRGGAIELELGLFSVKAVDLAGPFLAVLEEMASTAGVSFVSTALPFVGPLKAGLNLFANGASSALEVGIATELAPPSSGTWVVMRAPKGTVPLSDLKLDEDFRLVDQTGKPFRDHPYLVWTVEARGERDDWFRIPELATTYKALQDELRGGKLTAIQETLTVFKRTAITCPDLLTADARRLAQLADDLVRQIVGDLNLTAARSTPTAVPGLSELPLFGGPNRPPGD